MVIVEFDYGYVDFMGFVCGDYFCLWCFYDDFDSCFWYMCLGVFDKICWFIEVCNYLVKGF